MWWILTTSCVVIVRSDCIRSKRRSRRFSRIRCWINRTIVILEIYDHCIDVLWGLHFHCQRMRGLGCYCYGGGSEVILEWSSGIDLNVI